MSDEELDEAEAVVEGLGGKDVTVDGQKLTAQQVSVVHARIRKLLGHDAVDTLDFDVPYSSERRHCCKQRTIGVLVFPRPIQGFNRKKEPTKTYQLCTNCGELKD